MTECSSRGSKQGFVSREKFHDGCSSGALVDPLSGKRLSLGRHPGTGQQVAEGKAPGECGRAMEEFLAAPGPAILQAAVDPFEPPMPAKVKAEQALHFAESLARGEPNRKKIALTTISDQVRELI